MHIQNIVAAVAMSNPLLSTTPEELERAMWIANNKGSNAWMSAPKHAREKVKQYMNAYFCKSYDFPEKTQ